MASRDSWLIISLVGFALVLMPLGLWLNIAWIRWAAGCH